MSAPPTPQSSVMGPLPPGQAGVGGAWWSVSRSRRGTWWRCWPWGHPCSAAGPRCFLALLSQPLVRAHLHMALQGCRWRASPTGHHARWCSGVLPSVPVGYTFRHLARAGRLGPSGLGALLQHYGPNTFCRPRVDRRLGCYQPHHPRPWYTLVCSPSFLSPIVHHGRQWPASSYHVHGCHWHSWLLSSS